MNRNKPHEWVGLADTLWAFLQTDIKGVRVPCLNEFSADELTGFIEGLHCARNSLGYMNKTDLKAFDDFETALVLVEVAARRQLRQLSCSAPILLVSEESEEQMSQRAKRASDFPAQITSTTAPESITGHG